MQTNPAKTICSTLYLPGPTGDLLSVASYALTRIIFSRLIGATCWDVGPQVPHHSMANASFFEARARYLYAGYHDCSHGHLSLNCIVIAEQRPAIHGGSQQANYFRLEFYNNDYFDQNAMAAGDTAIFTTLLNLAAALRKYGKVSDDEFPLLPMEPVPVQVYNGISNLSRVFQVGTVPWYAPDVSYAVCCDPIDFQKVVGLIVSIERSGFRH